MPFASSACAPPSQFHARRPAAGRRVEARSNAGRLSCSTSPRSGSLQPRTLALSTGATIACSRSTRRTACRSGATISAPTTCQLSAAARALPNVPRIALTATADERTREEIASAQLARSTPRTFVAGFDRPNIRYTIARSRLNARQQLHCAFSMASTRATPASSTACRATQGGGDGRVAQRSRVRTPCRITPASTRTTRAEQPGPLPARGRRDHRGDHRLRHGHRQARRALRRAPRHAQERRSLLPGNRARRARRRTRRCLDGVRPAGRRTSCVRCSRIPRASEEHKRVERHKLDALLGWCEITSCRRHAAARATSATTARRAAAATAIPAWNRRQDAGTRTDDAAQKLHCRACTVRGNASAPGT